MTARPLVPATRVVRRFSQEITWHDVHRVPSVLKTTESTVVRVV